MNPQQQQENPLLPNYQFSSEELRALRECNDESLYQRSIPIGTALGLAAYAGVKQGFLTPNVKFGAVPKVVVGVIIGYFLGKFSYRQKCAEKLMALPNSKVGEILRQQRSQTGFAGLKQDHNIGMGMALGPFAPNATDVYSDEHLHPDSRGNALNLDVESRPSFSGLDDSYRPNLDSAATTHVDADIPLNPVKPGTTYDELRNRNREQFMKKQQNPFAQPLPPDAPVVMRVNPSQQRPAMQQEETPARNVQRNKYGDAWQE